MRIFSEEAYLSVDYAKRVGMVIKKSANLDLIQMAREHDASDLAELAGSVDYARLLKTEELVVDDSAEPLRKQAEAFRDTVEKGAPPVVSAVEGLAAIQVAHQILDCVKRHRWDGEDSARKGPDILQKD
jgi:hypothetical protein